MFSVFKRFEANNLLVDTLKAASKIRSLLVAPKNADVVTSATGMTKFR